MKLTPNQKSLFSCLSFNRWLEILPGELPTLKLLKRRDIVSVKQSEGLTLARLHPRLKPTKAQLRILNDPLLKIGGMWSNPQDLRMVLALGEKGLLNLGPSELSERSSRKMYWLTPVFRFLPY